MPSEEDCVRALRNAAKRPGESPTKAQYEALGMKPASGTIIRTLGGWNAAKEAAGLETFTQAEGGGTPVQPKPPHVEIPDDRERTELGPQQRWYYKNRERRVAVKSEQKARLGRWLYEYKRDCCACERCGESHPGCLDFHHLGEKTMNVSEMVTRGFARGAIEREIDGCVVLCANCHRVEHYEEPRNP